MFRRLALAVRGFVAAIFLVLAPLTPVVAEDPVPAEAPPVVESELFFATVETLYYAPATGKIMLTLAFTGKGFGTDYRISILRGTSETDCGDLMDDRGNSYTTKSCLPAMKTWDGIGGTAVRSGQTTRMTFIFNGPPAAPDQNPSRFVFALPFQLATCSTLGKVRRERGVEFSSQSGSPDECASGHFRFSVESFSFSNIAPANPKPAALPKPIARMAPPYAKVESPIIRSTPKWTTHDKLNQVTAQFTFTNYIAGNVNDHLICIYRLIGPRTVEITALKSAYELPSDLQNLPDTFDEVRVFTVEAFTAPRQIKTIGLFSSNYPSHARMDGKWRTETGAFKVYPSLYYVGPSSNLGRWESETKDSSLRGVMLQGEYCLKLGRSIPGDDPLSGTLRTLAKKISWRSI